MGKKRRLVKGSELEDTERRTQRGNKEGDASLGRHAKRMNKTEKSTMSGTKEGVPKSETTTKRENKEVETKRRSTGGAASGSSCALPKSDAEKKCSKGEEKVESAATPGSQTEGYLHERLPMLEVDQHKQRWRLEVRNANKDNQSLLMRKVTGTPMQIQLAASPKEGNLQDALQFMMGVFDEVINMTSTVTKPMLEEKKRLFLSKTSAQPPRPKTPVPTDHPYTKQRSSSSLASSLASSAALELQNIIQEDAEYFHDNYDDDIKDTTTQQDEEAIPAHQRDKSDAQAKSTGSEGTK
eukprot:4283922-Amphidinium_carterae.1